MISTETKQSATSTFLSALFGLVLDAIKNPKNLVNAIGYGIPAAYATFAYSMSQLDAKNAIYWIGSIALVGWICITAANLVNSLINGGFDVTAVVKKWVQEEQDALTKTATNATSTASGSIETALKAFSGVVLVDANNCKIDVKAWRDGGGVMKNDAATEGGLYITATEGGQTMKIENATYDPKTNTVHCMSQIQDAFVNAFGALDPLYVNPTLDKFTIYSKMLIAANPLQFIINQISSDKRASLVTLEDQVVFGMDGNQEWNGMTQAQKDAFNTAYLNQAYALESNVDETNKAGRPRAQLLENAKAFWNRYY